MRKLCELIYTGILIVTIFSIVWTIPYITDKIISRYYWPTNISEFFKQVFEKVK